MARRMLGLGGKGRGPKLSLRGSDKVVLEIRNLPKHPDECVAAYLELVSGTRMTKIMREDGDYAVTSANCVEFEYQGKGSPTCCVRLD